MMQKLFFSKFIESQLSNALSPDTFGQKVKENDLFEFSKILQNSIFLNEKALFVKKN